MHYKRSKYFTTLSKRKIKYLFIKKNSLITVVFFHGFMSDMIGAKPTAIQKFCRKQKLSFLKFEYSGHGKSTGKFTEGNISKWTDESKQLIKSKIKKDKNEWKLKMLNQRTELDNQRKKELKDAKKESLKLLKEKNKQITTNIIKNL